MKTKKKERLAKGEQREREREFGEEGEETGEKVEGESVKGEGGEGVWRKKRKFYFNESLAEG